MLALQGELRGCASTNLALEAGTEAQWSETNPVVQHDIQTGGKPLDVHPLLLQPSSQPGGQAVAR